MNSILITQGIFLTQFQPISSSSNSKGDIFENTLFAFIHLFYFIYLNLDPSDYVLQRILGLH
jgi:hypothetical protein